MSNTKCKLLLKNTDHLSVTTYVRRILNDYGVANSFQPSPNLFSNEWDWESKAFVFGLRLEEHELIRLKDGTIVPDILYDLLKLLRVGSDLPGVFVFGHDTTELQGELWAVVKKVQDMHEVPSGCRADLLGDLLVGWLNGLPQKILQPIEDILIEIQDTALSPETKSKLYIQSCFLMNLLNIHSLRLLMTSLAEISNQNRKNPMSLKRLCKIFSPFLLTKRHQGHKDSIDMLYVLIANSQEIGMFDPAELSFIYKDGMQVKKIGDGNDGVMRVLGSNLVNRSCNLSSLTTLANAESVLPELPVDHGTLNQVDGGLDIAPGSQVCVNPIHRRSKTCVSDKEFPKSWPLHAGMRKRAVDVVKVGVSIFFIFTLYLILNCF